MGRKIKDFIELSLTEQSLESGQRGLVARAFRLWEGIVFRGPD
jgi:hypothetical protein